MIALTGRSDLICSAVITSYNLQLLLLIVSMLSTHALDLPV